MAELCIGIIGGTGLDEVLKREAGGEPVNIDTPFGPPSAPPIRARWEGVDVLFLTRHGPGHRFNPTTVPYRANVWALKALGAQAILASGATGSLREDVKPGDLVVCDQIIDRTVRRPNTFFDEGPVVHVELAQPFCPHLRAVLLDAGARLEQTVHSVGVYVCMEGPQFSTRAESDLHRQWGGDLIGMTCMPEAKLAREAELCYALIALPTDYDCWRSVSDAVPREALLAEILRNLHRASEGALRLIREGLRVLRDAGPSPCSCGRALDLAIWSDVTALDGVARQRLKPLLRRRLSDTTQT